MRTIQAGFSVIDAFEEWLITVPDDAPEEITKEWLNENIGEVEFTSLLESWQDRMELVEIYES